MASSYSTDLKLELMVTGENAGTWGDKTNTNLNLVQQAIAGVQSIDVGASDVTLVMSNAALSNARNMVLTLTGSLAANRQVLIPNGIEKFYIIHDQTTRNGFSLTIKTVSGSGFAMETTTGSSDMAACYSDGTDVYEVSLNTLSGSIASAQIDALAVTSGKLASFAVTSARLASYAVTTARLATNAVTAIKITQSTITQAKLAANSVGANQLISTGVTAGAYTAASITVDADGRITAASSGSAGAGMGIPTLYATGPSSASYTATPTANRLGVYMFAGGGGGGGGAIQNRPGGAGGAGGFGFYNKPIVQPFSQPYSVGAPGNAGNYAGNNGNAGGAGGATNFTNVGTVNAGNAGNGGNGPAGVPGNSGNAGTQPGASFTYPDRTFVVGGSFGSGGTGGNPGTMSIMCGGQNPANPGSAGGSGGLIIFENTGT
jgi:hypothetical protein